MHNFYNINLLKINPDKTQLMVVHKPKHDKEFQNFYFMAKSYKIKKMFKMKILGSLISSDLGLDPEINLLVSTLSERINGIRKITPYTDEKTRLQFANSFIISRLNYMLAMYTNLNEKQNNKLHKIIMTTARAVIGSYCFKISIDKILKRCKWLKIQDQIKHSALKFIHNVVTLKKPKSLSNILKFNSRSTAKISFNYFAKSKRLRNSLIFKGTRLYNNLPNFYKSLPKKKFKVKLKKEALIVHDAG